MKALGKAVAFFAFVSLALIVAGRTPKAEAAYDRYRAGRSVQISKMGKNTLLELAWLKKGSPSTAAGCPYTATAATDGCNGAPSGNPYSNVRISNFFTGYAQQNTPTPQTWPSNAGGVGDLACASNPSCPNMSAPHPPWNVAGVDYDEAILASAIVTPGSDAYDRNNDLSSKGYGLKRMTNANLTTAGMFSTTNGCDLNSAPRLKCQGTIATLVWDGWDFTAHTTGSDLTDGVYFLWGNMTIGDNKVVIKNSYLAPAAQSYSQTTLYSISTNVFITLLNNLIDGRSSWATLQDGTSWFANNGGDLAMMNFSGSTTGSNPDCVPYSVVVCVKYNGFIRSVSRMMAIGMVNCPSDAPCMAMRSMYNYHELGTNMQAQIQGFVDNGQGPSGTGGAYNGTPGVCLTITNTDFGFPIKTGPSGSGGIKSQGWNVLSPNPLFNIHSNAYYLSSNAINPSGQGCNAAYPNTSFAIGYGNGGTASGFTGFALSPQTMFLNSGTHGDPYFVSFSGTVPLEKWPMSMGGWANAYNVLLMPEKSWSSTGLSTFNTSTGPSVRGATWSDGGSGSGNILNITNVATGVIPSPNTTGPTLTFTSGAPDIALAGYNLPAGADVRLGCTTVPTGFAANTDYFVVNPGANTIQLAASAGGAAITPTSTGSACRVQIAMVVGLVIPGGTYGVAASSPFPASGLKIVGSAFSGATCGSNPCTGTGMNGTYLVDQSGRVVNWTGSLESSAMRFVSLVESHNVYVGNFASDFVSNSSGGVGMNAAPIGDNHPLIIDAGSVDNIYYDPNASLFCMYPVYVNAPTPSGGYSSFVANNVNLLGNSGGTGWDTNANSASLCFGHQ